MRYTATFSFDADSFDEARSFARRIRNQLRDEYGMAAEYAAHDAKLRKLVDPYANDEDEASTENVTTDESAEVID